LPPLWLQATSQPLQTSVSVTLAGDTGLSGLRGRGPTSTVTPSSDRRCVRRRTCSASQVVSGQQLHAPRVGLVVAWGTQRLPVVEIEAEFGESALRLEVMRLKPYASRPAHLAGVVIALEYRLAPRLVLPG